VYEEKFQVFLAAAFVLLCADALLADRRRRRTVLPGQGAGGS
jgi:hypothetical protein